MSREGSPQASPFVLYLSWLEERLWPCDVPRRLVGDLLPGVPVEHAEEVVVGPGHDGSVVTVPAALELVENAVVLVQGAELGAQVLVDLEIRFKITSSGAKL